MKKLLTILIFGVSILNAQNEFNDYFVYKNKDTIKCKITKVKNQYIYFDLSPDNKFILKRDMSKNLKARKSTQPRYKKLHYTPSRLFFYQCDDIFLSSKTKEELELNKIEKPEDGFAHVYFYRPNSDPRLDGFIIREGDSKIINLKINSYFLVKVKAGTEHTYYVNKSLSSKDKVSVLAKNKGIFFIQGFYIGCNYSGGLGFNGTIMPMGNGRDCGNNLSINEDEYAELQVLSMYKKPKRVTY
ncbi:hypothetical protein F6U93_14450 [Tamlana haliotis]|uniref:Uncharacterized protein n=1 Tax=Pseudotamlana haliotis TaxID=2614804 RepID=A0A6N6M859_9FLAO|nr:hypothetical protein [Tamlana haliotis]KAB1064284.1 hypothetical protein F6U93_14450 [Tamlana haliotis]